jgi:succinate dehydrogenase / fumarate reductase cytochrome b subunit
MPSANRPMSPHLQVYKLPLLALLSITHRVTGVALCAGTLILVYWLVSLAGGPEAHASAHAVLSSVPGLIVMFGFTWALYFHFCNGIRHLVWDTGRGLSLESADRSGQIAAIGSVLLTIFTWIFAFALSGGGA